MHGFSLPLACHGRQLAASLASLFLALALAAPVFADTTYNFSYSGRFTDASGKPVAGPVGIKVTFFHDSLGQAPIFQTTQGLQSVPLSDGVFQFNLALTGTDYQKIFSDVTQPVYIEITDLTNASTQPYALQQVSMVPYAGKVPVDGGTISFNTAGQLNVGPDSAPGTNQFLTKDSNGNLIWGTPAAPELAGQEVSSTSPTSGQVLSFNGSLWAPTTLATGTTVASGSYVGLTGGTMTGPLNLGSNTLSAGSEVVGSGDATGTPGAGVLRGANASGNNIPGSNLTLAAGDGTGTGMSGSILFQTAAANASGSTATTLATAMAITPGGNIGIGTTVPSGLMSLYGSGSVPQLVFNGSAAEGGTDTNGIAMQIGIDYWQNRQLWIGDSYTIDTPNSTNTVLRLSLISNVPTIDAVSTDNSTQKQLEVGNSVGVYMPGNLGIGTASPSHALEVAGAAANTLGGSWVMISDRRMKDIEGDYEFGLAAIKKLHTVRFRYKLGNALGLPTEQEHTGFIAQEVLSVIPDAVITRPDGYYELNVDPIHWATVNAVQELAAASEADSATIAALQARLAAAEADNRRKADELADLKGEVATLRAALCTKIPGLAGCP